MTEKAHLYVASPTHYACEPEFVYSLLRLTHALQEAEISYSIDLHAGESLITRARNKIVAKFLKSPATHLFFVDSDQSFASDDVLRLLEANKPLVGALIPKKGIDWDKVRGAAERKEADLEGWGASYVVNPEQNTVRVDETGCVPVFAVGTGFMLIERCVIEGMINALPETEYRGDDTENDTTRLWALFDCAIEPESKRYLSEDFEFCRRAKAIGVQPWLHVGVKSIGHVGRHHYRGNVASAFYMHKAA